jgi:hypothetical protein
MDPFVTPPHWAGTITWYFYLGGIAAGAYSVAALAALFGGETDHRATRPAHYIALRSTSIGPRGSGTGWCTRRCRSTRGHFRPSAPSAR